MHVQSIYRSNEDNENTINAVARRCRIGKVKLKRDIVQYPFIPSPFLRPPGLLVGQTFGTPNQCLQCVGKACGNAACPSRPVVMC